MTRTANHTGTPTILNSDRKPAAIIITTASVHIGDSVSFSTPRGTKTAIVTRILDDSFRTISGTRHEVLCTNWKPSACA